eukprot:CAMPEP_0204860732 /NCGR_PEP_ID=MMETSP1348-20121228/806_1 /ASSEMBLY_ACC=CAM_ASM_000700 /TAXON_ID=215587 /ORGANISM="Aplanochytrium stocchinoi, Strain GSBS06" /LENGTH=701 /DNA_ID=CAMNT_0052009653 /DNA_START=440 /DNA_END=2545 /DNA_ORIENTATION=-
MNFCVSTHCEGRDLRDHFMHEIDSVVNVAASVAKILGHDSKNISDGLKNYMKEFSKVYCTDEARKMDMGGYIWTAFVCTMLSLVMLSTLYDLFFLRTRDWWNNGIWGKRLPSEQIDAEQLYQYHPRNRLEKTVTLFSAIRNSGRLVSCQPGDFNSLNGIRVISMFWVILGHTVLLTMFPPVANPTEQQQAMQAFSFTIIKGGEYSVDTFFFISGFLATWGIINQVGVHGLSLKRYLLLIIGRWLRLTPSYAVILFFYWQVFPFISNGPYWDDVYGLGIANPIDGCKETWWKNLLYINNFVGDENFNICMPWSWYLSNDMQFYLLVPILVVMFLKGKDLVSATKNSHGEYQDDISATTSVNADENSNGYSLIVDHQDQDSAYPLQKKNWFGYSLIFGPCLLLMMIQMVTTLIIMDHNSFNGVIVNTDFTKKVYYAPWCRISPYALGVLVAFIHDLRVSSDPTGWQILNLRYVVTVFFGALGIMGAIIFGAYSQFNCQEKQEECDVWFGFILYGALRNQNIDQVTADIYYSLTYPGWAFAIACICYIFFCGYDFGISWFLSHKMFTPLARLTYNAYLFHMIIMWIVDYSVKRLPTYDPYELGLKAVAFVMLSYAIAAALYLVVEKPIMNIVAYHMRKKRHRSPRATVPIVINGANDGAQQQRHEELCEPNVRRRIMTRNNSLERSFSRHYDPNDEALTMMQTH